MKNLVKSMFTLNDTDTMNKLLEWKKDLPKYLTCAYYPQDNAIEVKCNGQSFDSISLDGGTMDDAILLDKDIHGYLQMKDLSIFGTYFHMYETSAGINSISLHRSGSGATLTYITFYWDLNLNTVVVELAIDPRRAVMNEKCSAFRHARVLQYLQQFDKVEILDEGWKDVETIIKQKEEIEKVNSDIPIVVEAQNLITVLLSGGIPTTVKELVDIVEEFREDVYQNSSNIPPYY